MVTSKFAELALGGFGSTADARGEAFEPSDAFCRAVDHEPEESPEDRMALGLDPLQPPDLARPRGPGGAAPGECSRDPGAAALPEGPKAALPPGKRVRFAAGSDEMDEGGGGGGKGKVHRVPVGHRRDRDRGRCGVPDHVKNPGKYTCYSLDEPLYIGQRSDAGPPARTSSQSADANAPVLGSRAGDWGRDYLSEVEVAAETALSERPGAHAFRPRAGERGGGA